MKLPAFLKSAMLIMVALIMVATAAGCQQSNGGGSGTGDTAENGENGGGAAQNQAVEFEFWSAPNPTQQAFWTEMANAYMEENEHVTIKVSPIPESPSSEAGIQSAIAAGNAPAVTENISRGFAAQLAESGAIVPLETFEGYTELIEERKMQKTMEGWTFADGHQYVLPIYSNAILFAWRLDILQELGYEAPPKTYSEVLELGERLKEAHPDKFLWARADLVKPTWWARWFDFFMLYNAASGGNGFIEGSELAADDQAGIKTRNFSGISRNGICF